MAKTQVVPQTVQQVSGMTKSVSAPIANSGAPKCSQLLNYYDALFAAHGPQHWWPGRSRFEIIVGALLVQNTAWTNAATAIRNLRREMLLNPRAIQEIKESQLAELIRSSGYYRQKAKKLKSFVEFLFARYDGSLSRMFRTKTVALREELLTVHGIGPETADSILLYAGGHAVFVVDAYARRILERHGLAARGDSYEDVRAFFEGNLPRDARLFNEYHALMVHTGKTSCFKAEPDCSHCALRPFLNKQIEPSTACLAINQTTAFCENRAATLP